MDIKSHVSQAATAAAATVGYLGGVAAGTTERWILSLPRLLKAATDEKLVNLPGKSLVGGTAYDISLKTGKTSSQTEDVSTCLSQQQIPSKMAKTLSTTNSTNKTQKASSIEMISVARRTNN